MYVSSLDVRPEFDSEHRIVVLVNGSPVEGGPFEEADIEVQGLHRGTHELQALLRDAEGRTLARSGTVTIYLHQASALSPNR
ncbi:MAG: hypothetical protein U5L11_10975 [Arhodomonas sp.]|nr:hypothetical protein [Arhodomonas sp.]